MPSLQRKFLARSIPCSLIEAGPLEAINVGVSVSLKDRGYQDEPVRSWTNISKLTLSDLNMC